MRITSYCTAAGFGVTRFLWWADERAGSRGRVHRNGAVRAAGIQIALVNSAIL